MNEDLKQSIIDCMNMVANESASRFAERGELVPGVFVAEFKSDGSVVLKHQAGSEVFFRSEQSKAVLGGLVGQVLANAPSGVRIGVLTVSEAWLSHQVAESRPSQASDRREVIAITLATREGVTMGHFLDIVDKPHRHVQLKPFKWDDTIQMAWSRFSGQDEMAGAPPRDRMH